ncbi:related to quinic acid utilization activator [Rhynchosporium secalis]|uniref:Related to quinic acid utilization activator n=1 Tax=Rhynchosporium secalis TaxID=38038 RepID=A0A1E1MUI4_RHYSE|nr:related to quinic acid utilization activator [Rhynchosporium secalis]
MAEQARMGDGPLGENNEKAGIEGEELKKKSSKHGGPRKRVSQACDKCRSRKDKCDGKKPMGDICADRNAERRALACSTCISNDRECTYDANVKKRGLPEGYVRGLEKLWGLTIRDVDAIGDKILSALAGDEESKESPLATWNNETNSDALVDIWRKSTISRELERLLSSQEPTELKRKRMTSNDHGRKSVQRNALQEKDTSRSQADPDYPSARWSERVPNLMTQNDHQTPPNASAVDPSFLPREYESVLSPNPAHAAPSNGNPAAGADALPDLPSETWHLLDIYFSYTHSWFPIVEKHDLLKTSYQYSQMKGDSSSAGSGENAVLWAAIAYAKFQCRAINDIFCAPGAIGDVIWTAERMYAQARSLVPNEDGNIELGHVQALLILSLANIGMGHFTQAWSLIGQAVRSAIELQLDRPSDQSRAKSRFKHVFLGCFALETLIAARLNRRPHLRALDADLVGLLDEDGLEEWDPWTDCVTVRRSSLGNPRLPASILSTFNRLIQVLQILNDACCCSDGASTIHLSTVLLRRLHVWSQAQSPPLYFDSTARGSEEGLSLLPHQYHLHNVYFTTLARSQLLSSNHGNVPVNLEPCTQSACHTVDLLSQHLNALSLLIVPPTYEYFVKSAYDIVHAVHSSIESTHIGLDHWKRSLDHCLDTMKSVWPVFEIFKSSAAYRSTIQAPRSRSQAAFDLIMDQESDTSMSRNTPRSLASYDAFDPFSPQNSRAPAEAQQSPDVSHLQASRPSFGSSSTGHGLPQNPRSIYEDVHATIGSAKRHPSNQQHRRQAAVKPPGIMAPQAPFTINQPSIPQLHQSLTMSSTEVELDPMFNELMRLDATEWAGNWDQSLMNLGFTDSDNMNQDFYAFCQEPDPLHPNTIFQQLVANSNAETNNFFDGSGLGHSMDQMPGGFAGVDGVMADENEGIEVGQILQALSAADDQRGGG